MLAIVVVGAVGYWGYDQYQEKQQLEVYIGNKYQQAFYELVEHVEQLQVLIGKSLVSTSPRQNIMILTDVWSHSNTAQAELNKLPLAAQTVYDTAKFLSQAGDFSHVMARQNAEGKVLSSENRKTLNQLRQHAVSIADSLHQVENEVLAGKVNWVNLVKNARQGIKREEEGEGNNVNLEDVREEMTKIPTLIYDGPFSDHITERKPRALDGEDISQEAARDKAREVIDKNYMVEGDLRREISLNIKRLMEIGSYRGVRHRRGLPVRGQRTKTNARTRKGVKRTVGKGKK